MQKHELNQIAIECGIRIPREELLRVGELPKTLKYPVFTKAATSANGDGWKDQAHICNNEEELLAAYKTMHVDTILVQEYIKKKQELCINGLSILEGKEVYMPYACSYHRTKPDGYGSYKYLYHFTDKELTKKISLLLKKVQFTGIFDIEFLVGEDDELYFMEVNFRNSGCSYACTDGGFNLPFRWSVSMLENKLYLDNFTPLEKFDAMNEIADYYDFVKTKKISIFEWIKDIKSSRSFYLYNAKDSAPFWNYIFQKIKKKLR